MSHILPHLLKRFLAACVVLWFTHSLVHGAEPSWRAGVARTIITPTTPMSMAGYASRNHPAEGKLTDIWAKAIALEDASGHRSVLITLDLIGIDRALSQSICDKISQRHQLQRQQIAIATSHTHTGPIVARNLRPMHYVLLDKTQRHLVDKYASFLEQRVTDVVAQAIAALAPAQIHSGSGTATFATNRRNNRETDVPKLREAGQLQGPTDHDVPVLTIREQNGKLTAVVFGYACHATTLSFYRWSGDYPGFAQIELERLNPGVIAMFWAGCGADQNPLPRRTVELAKQYGTRLAAAVQKVVGGDMETVSPRLTTQYDEVALPLATLPTREQIEQDTESRNVYTAARARMLLADIDAGGPLAATYPYPIATWKLGDSIVWIFLGGEVVVDYSLRLKAELNGKSTWVVGYANDVMAYIPSRRVLREGGYEGGGAMVYYGLPAHWNEQVERIIVDEVHRQVKGSP